jgi:glycosyltransferase involved in cell wall biosynthesis
MRILILTDELYPDAIGGVGKSVYNEAAALVRQGHAVTVLVRCLNHDLPPRSEVDGIQIDRFYGPERRQRLYYLYPFAVVYHAARWLQQHKDELYDVLYVHNPLYILAVRLARVTIPLIYTFYASIPAEIRITARSGKYGKLAVLAYIAANILGFIERWALSQAGTILHRSMFTSEMLHQIYPANRIPEKIVPLGVDVSRFTLRSKLETRKQLGLPEERTILITVRRLEGRMGLLNLVQAIHKVREQFPDVLLLIVGKGYMRPKLEAFITENALGHNVQLLGFVSEDDLPIYLSASDLFVLPTEMLEGFGLATIEALASGLPVVGTVVGATPEILFPIEPRLLTRNTSVDALADLLCYWLRHPDQVGALSERCRAEVLQRYSIDLVARQLQDIFESTITDSICG